MVDDVGGLTECALEHLCELEYGRGDLCKTVTFGELPRHVNDVTRRRPSSGSTSCVPRTGCNRLTGPSQKSGGFSQCLGRRVRFGVRPLHLDLGGPLFDQLDDVVDKTRVVNLVIRHAGQVDHVGSPPTAGQTDVGLAASPGPLTTQPITDRDMGVEICASRSSSTRTVSMTEMLGARRMGTKSPSRPDAADPEL